MAIISKTSLALAMKASTAMEQPATTLTSVTRPSTSVIAMLIVLILMALITADAEKAISAMDGKTVLLLYEYDNVSISAYRVVFLFIGWYFCVSDGIPVYRMEFLCIGRYFCVSDCISVYRMEFLCIGWYTATVIPKSDSMRDCEHSYERNTSKFIPILCTYTSKS